MMEEDVEVNDIFDDDLDNMVESNEGEANEGNEENLGNDIEDDSTQTARRVEVKKRVVRNPRVTLNAERLCGERGIAALPKAFEGVKFKGKGHEKENLDKLMSILKHWSYRLFPSMCFSDVLETIERLGKKKPVQVCLRKIRLGMPVLNEDFTRDDSDDNDDTNRDIFDTAEGDQGDINNMNPLDLPDTSRALLSENAFDELIKEHGQYMDVPMTHDNENVNADSLLLNDFPARSSTVSPETVKSLTEQQKERIERNAMLARERRAQSKSIDPVDSHVGDELEVKAACGLDSSLNATMSNTVSNIPLMHSFKELEFRNHSELEPVFPAKESVLTECRPIDFELPPSSEASNLNNSDSEMLSYIKQPDTSRTDDFEPMFSSDESNDGFKLNITTDVLLKCGEHQSGLAKGGREIIE